MLAGSKDSRHGALDTQEDKSPYFFTDVMTGDVGNPRNLWGRRVAAIAHAVLMSPTDQPAILMEPPRFDVCAASVNVAGIVAIDWWKMAVISKPS